MITRNEIQVPEFYVNYIRKAGDDDLLKALAASTRRFRKLLKDIPKKKIDYAYAEGKWTIRQLLQHIMDAERVFSLRSLWIARLDPSGLPGFEENIWADSAIVTNRKWKDMVEEFLTLREANRLMYESFSDEELRREGNVGNNRFTAAAFGFVSAGHLQHHLDIIDERYLAEAPKKKNGKDEKVTVKDAKKKKQPELTM